MVVRFGRDAVVARSARAHGLRGPVDSVEAALVAAAGIYGSAQSSHPGLAARIDDYAAGELAAATLDRRSVLRVPAMRGTIFLVPRKVAPAALALSRAAVVRRTRAAGGLNDAEADRLAHRIEGLLSERAMATRDLRVALGTDAPRASLLTILVRELCHEGRIVATRQLGEGRGDAYVFARLEDWAPLGGPIPNVPDALRVMAPVWMAANGPGTVDDLAWWAGVTRAEAADAMATMGAREVEVDGLSPIQLATDDVIDDLAQAEQGEPSGEVRLLPVWDAWLMARRDRTRILDVHQLPFVVDRGGNVTNTVVVDGRVAGIWDTDGRSLLVSMFEPSPEAAIEAAAERLRRTVEWDRIDHAAEPRPLDRGGQNAFRAPLRARAAPA